MIDWVIYLWRAVQVIGWLLLTAAWIQTFCANFGTSHDE